MTTKHTPATPLPRMNTCRVCRKQEFGGAAASMFKYGTRHYAHGKCGLQKFGASFLDMIPAHTLGNLPYFALEEAGLLDVVELRIKEAA